MAGARVVGPSGPSPRGRRPTLVLAGLAAVASLGTSACATTAGPPPPDAAASPTPSIAATFTTAAPSAPSGSSPRDGAATPDAPSIAPDGSTASGSPSGPSPATSEGGGRLACSGVGPSFTVEALAGPRIRPDELPGTEAGRALAAEFDEDGVDGELAAFAPDAFVVLSQDDDMMTYGGTQQDEVVSWFELERRDGEWKLIGWGGCRPTRVRTDLQAASWQVVGTDRGGRVLELEVEGGECVDDREETRTRIVDVVVEEAADEVSVVVWVEQPPPPDGAPCAGVGVTVPASITLDDPLGSRPLVDGGTVPSTLVCHDGAEVGC